MIEDLAKNCLLIIDMWNNHWCPQAVEQANRLAPQINTFKKKFSKKGNLIIHAPSGYKMEEVYSANKRWLNVELDPSLNKHFDPITDLNLPIYHGLGSCPGNPKMSQVWTGIHKDIEIAETDYISNNARQIFQLLTDRKIKWIHVCGLHLNMCILKNGYGIINLVKNGFKVRLMSNLTDIMYNSMKHPFVSVEEAKEIMLKFVEDNYCEVI